MERQWQCGKWICAKTMPKEYAQCAPRFHAELVCDQLPRKAEIFLSAPGWHELYINGTKADDRLLIPAPMQYDKHIPYTVYEISALLKPGKNQLAILAGNGFFNCGTENVWNFQHAVWRNQFPMSPQPRILCECEFDGKVVLGSDSSWHFSPSPVIFNEIRNGEYYDARMEEADLPTLPVSPAIPPQGELMADKVSPCRVIRKISPVTVKNISPGVTVYDFGINLTGWVNIEVAGNAGDTLTLRYSERLKEDGSVDQTHIGKFVLSGKFQTDRYTLRGAADGESWHPRFVWHGFRYVSVEFPAGVEVKNITAVFISSDFPQCGSLKSSFDAWQKLQEVTVRSLRANFIGFPTDCPHREKNGWTADAQLAAESMMWNFDAASGYENFLQMAADCQQPSGGIASILPTSGWGYGINPAWDFVIFELPRLLHLFSGDDGVIRKIFPVCEKYLAHCRSSSENDLLDFGLGDWCSPAEAEMPPREFSSSAYLYLMHVIMAEFAGIIGTGGADTFLAHAEKIRTALTAKYYNPDGSWSNDSLTANALALSFGFAVDRNKELAHLVESCRRCQHKAHFGIIGAKYLPRLLADEGYIDDAAEFFIQSDYPGWQHFLCSGATTLWETWKGTASQNHAMFGDFSAWCYRYIAGIRPAAAAPGFRKFTIAPQLPEKIGAFSAEYRTITGGIIKSAWEKTSLEYNFYITIPENSSAELLLPGENVRRLSAGEYSFKLTR